MSINDLFTALPDGSEINKAVLRNALVRRVSYTFAPTENPSDFIANNDGSIPIVLGYNGEWFWLDIDDAISGPGDNTTLIVTADNYRYFSDGRIAPVWFLLSQNDTTPPVSPTIGDAYHTAAAPTGAWAGYPNMIAVYTRRGWIFQTIPRGRSLLVADEGAYYHMNASNVFTLGMGNASVGAGTVRDTMLFGGARTYLVENQTTNAPPALTPGTGSAYYVVGASPSGAWVGQTGKIAVAYDGITWTFITPTEGMQIYDRALNARYDYNGGWTAAAGAWVFVDDVYTVSGSTTTASSTQYSYSTTPPSTSDRRFIDSVTLTRAAHRTGTRLLRFKYTATANISIGASATYNTYVVALFRDSDTAALAWVPIAVKITGAGTYFDFINVEFLIDTVDTASHIYRIAIVDNSSAGANKREITALTYRTFSVEEKF